MSKVRAVGIGSAAAPSRAVAKAQKMKANGLMLLRIESIIAIIGKIKTTNVAFSGLWMKVCEWSGFRLCLISWAVICARVKFHYSNSSAAHGCVPIRLFYPRIVYCCDRQVAGGIIKRRRQKGRSAEAKESTGCWIGTHSRISIAVRMRVETTCSEAAAKKQQRKKEWIIESNHHLRASQEDGLFVDLWWKHEKMRRLGRRLHGWALILCGRNRLFRKHGLDTTVRYRLRD